MTASLIAPDFARLQAAEWKQSSPQHFIAVESSQRMFEHDWV
jgi:hypothetical protein